ncbi:tail fiber domain-containing protein [Blautia wexlerae]|uniref:tail fiber domain-containing protein n=1 Tax=Blautia wexlerae TaxID=418240 RepID=UPI001570BB10|nr:tail fiber domain-containing protein [Blautia wexlerae]NSG63708.1 hypothetical protein [Blautia wexlerae]
MELSKVIIDDFAKVTNDDRHISQNTTLYGTIKVNGDKNYVQLDGSDLLTPCSSSVNVKDGERVMVVVGGHEAVVTGNMSSPAARLGDVDDAKKEIGETVDQSLDAYDVKLAQMNELAANTLGFYYTEEKAADGSIIAYRHDKAELSESKIIYKNGIDGFFLSVDGGQTWKAGFDSNGDAVLNILYAIGIQSKWINTRGFTATDNSGKETFKIDENTGSVYIDPNTFMLGDKGIADTINGIVSDASTVFMLLSNEYQGIVTDANGNIVGDFPNCQTTITIMSGNDDVTSEATIQPTLKKGLTGEWDAETFTYTVTGLTEDNCYIEFTALYNDSTVKRRFTVCKQRYGKDGENAVSPVVSVEKKDGKTIISITDKTGTHTQEVLDGANGTPGPKGEDGKTSYFHVKYSDDGGMTFTDNAGEKAGAYIGTYTDHIKADSNIVSDYTWVKIEGKDGVSPTITVTKENGVVTIVTKDKSHTYTQKVLDGTNGTPGANGTNGQTTYFHLKYSNDGGKTFTSNNGEDVGSYIGTYTDFVKEDSDTPSDYTWVKIKGENGKDGKDGINGTNGKGISEIHTYYQANNQTSGIYVYSSGWSEAFTAPNSSSKYLWTYQKTIYNDGSSESTSPHIIGTYGKDGKDGSTLSSSEIWNLLLQQNTDFMYKGSDGKIYLKATYIDTGDFCGWQADRINKRLTATATDSGSDGDIDLSYGGQVILDASKAMVKTESPYSVYGGYDYAALCGNQVLANTAKIFSFLNNATFSKSITAEGSITGKNGLSISIGNVVFNKKLNVGDRLTVLEQIYAPNTPAGSGYTLYLTSGGFIKKSSSSKRYKKHVSFINDTDVKKLYELRPVYFNYKEGILDDDNEDCHRTIPGFYAELVDKYFPEAVVHDEKGRVDDWDVRKLVPAMLKLIQLQKEQLDRQEERLSKIESILNIKEE